MKQLRRQPKLTLLASVGSLVLALSAPLTAAAADPTTVDLGAADSFAVLGATAVTNVPTSTITGDVGLSPADGSNYSGITQAQVTGTIYAVDNTGPAGSVNNSTLLNDAQNALSAAYGDAAGRTPTQTFVGADNQLGGQILTPGVYAVPAASTANLIGTLTLDGQNNANAVFIFQSSSSLVTAAGSIVQLINGTQPCNVFWQVTSSATLGDNSTFKGNILALTSATVKNGADVEGSVLVRNAAVTLNANTITDTACATSNPPTPVPTPVPPMGGPTQSGGETVSLASAVSGSTTDAGPESLPASGTPSAIPLAMIFGLAGLWYSRRLAFASR